jgi:mRNA-degrading endonuclease RelE of RelBE toxin-antitoxin system
MNYNIVTYPQFEKELKRLAKKYKSLKSDFVTFLQELQENPKKEHN